MEYISNTCFIRITDLHHGCDDANKSQAIPKWFNWETGHGEIKMGP